MYASNRYEREPMQLPQNYGGNAFSTARQPLPTAQPHTEQKIEYDPLPQQELKPVPQAEPVQDAPQAERTSYSSEPRSQAVGGDTPLLPGGGARDWLSRLGVGQEELLLLCVLLLLRGEREDGENAESTDEVRWLILLLLMLH